MHITRGCGGVDRQRGLVIFGSGNFGIASSLNTIAKMKRLEMKKLCHLTGALFIQSKPGCLGLKRRIDPLCSVPITF